MLSTCASGWRSLWQAGGEPLALSPFPRGICCPPQLAVSIRHSHVRVGFPRQNRSRLLQLRQGGFRMFREHERSAPSSRARSSREPLSALCRTRKSLPGRVYLYISGRKEEMRLLPRRRQGDNLLEFRYRCRELTCFV